MVPNDSDSEASCGPLQVRKEAEEIAEKSIAALDAAKAVATTVRGAAG